MIQIYRTTGFIETVEDEEAKAEFNKDRRAFCQEAVGGYIEFAPGTTLSEVQIIVDEEGLLKKKPYNDSASTMAGCSLVGDAIVLTGDDRLD